MRILLDTCALSEIRKEQGSPAVKRFVHAVPDEDLFLSAVTIGEIVKGITLLKDSRKKAGLELWLENVQRHYHERILPLDTEAARIWGELTAKAQQKGSIIGAADGQIAAIAKRHGLHVMTRNVKDFEPTGAMIISPWE